MPSSAEAPSGAVGLLPPRGTLPAVTLRSRWWDRLGLRLLALIVAAATIPTLTLGLLVIRSGRGSHEWEVLARNREVARWGVEKVESFVGNALENMRLLINGGDLDPLDPREARPALSLFLSFMEDVKEITLLDARGRERVRLSEGTLYTSRDLGSRAGSPAFQAAQLGEVYIGPVTTSPHAEPFVNLALPIQDLTEGRVAGVLVAELNLKGLWEDVLSFQVGKSGYLYLVNPDGVLIAHPDFSLVLAGKEMREVPAIRRFLSGGEDLPPGGAAGYPNYLGQEVLGVFARSAKLGWGVIVEQPLAEALANVWQTKVATTVMLLNTLLLAILLGVLAARHVTRPVRELAAGAAAVGAGDFSHAIPVRGRDELAEVAGAFNWMTANLRQSFQGLRTLL
ncbi:MAG: HAMP domain-containing protein, partial [Candidatus Methylomirabilales bacterium]